VKVQHVDVSLINVRWRLSVIRSNELWINTETREVTTSDPCGAEAVDAGVVIDDERATIAHD
jgi:hypothetical protein